MVELTHISPHESRPAPAWQPRVLTAHELAPDERLSAELVNRSRDSVLSVIDGVVYAALYEADYVMTPGDRVVIPAGEPFQVWNAGDDVARVVTERG